MNRDFLITTSCSTRAAIVDGSGDDVALTSVSLAVPRGNSRCQSC